jgi:hypothetical protein
MRAVGAVLLLSGGAATAWCTRAAIERRRPVDIVAALLAPVAVLLALTGGVLLTEPGFLG